MKKHQTLTFPLLSFFVMLVAGCKQLQPGYYLTPENYAALPGTPVSISAPINLSPTPVSTVQAIAPSTPTPTPTLSPTPTITLTPTATPFRCSETQGTIELMSFQSQIAGWEFHYRVYLPPCYATTGRRYPYLIMMHGLVPNSNVMNDDQWDRMGLDEAATKGYIDGTLPPMIIIMPNGNDAWHGDDDSPFSRIIIGEMMPEIEARLCTWNESKARAIGGLSRGGFWAYSVAFQYPDLFDRIGGHSPFFYDGDYRVYNPYNLMDSAEGIERLTTYIDYASDDHNVDVGIGLFVDKLQTHNIQPTLVVNPDGAHSEDYWAAHGADYLAFYGAEWPRAVEDLPVCDLDASPSP